MPRQPVNNLIPNWNFENAPTFVAAQTTAGQYLTGTSTGSSTNRAYTWAIPSSGVTGGGEVQFDTSVFLSGTASIKLNNPATNSTSVASTSKNISTLPLSDAIPVLPNTSYTLSGWIKTNNVVTNGAYIDAREFTGAGGTVVTNNSNKLSGTNDWTQVSATFTTGATTRFVAVNLRNNTTGNISQAWFDDLRLDLTANTTRPAATNRLVVRDMKAALSFDGSTGCLTPGTMPTFTGAFTLSWWYKSRDGGTLRSLFGNFTDTNNAKITENGAGKWGIRVVHNGTFDQTISLPARGTWHKFHLVRNSSNIVTFYQDGALAGTLYSGAAQSGTFNFDSIGRASGTSFFNGIMARIMAWGSELTSTQIANDYFSSSIPTGASLNYQLDEGAGTTATDSSGNGNNGTITGATYTADTPMKARQLVGGNLVRNGDFEYAPPTNVPLTGSTKYIDGSAAGSTTNALFGWHKYSSGTSEVTFDTSVYHSGRASLRLSTVGTSQYAEVSWNPPDSVVMNRYAGTNFIPILPSTSYTLSFWLKTNYVSGSSSDGAYVQLIESTGNGSTSSNTVSTKVQTTTDWTKYSVVWTSNVNARFVNPQLRIYGHTGTGTLIMDAWFDDIVLTPTTAITRPLVT